jgi:hypothetical protein
VSYSEITLSRYLEELERTGLSLLIYRDGEVVFSSASGGIRPLLDAIDGLSRDEMRGSIVADKIVGRAAALLTVYMEAAEVHAALISTTAKEVLRRHGLSLHFAREVQVIKSREGVTICPFERLVQEVSDPEEAYEKIKAKMAEF